jgi:hypothetical protein
MARGREDLSKTSELIKLDDLSVAYKDIAFSGKKVFFVRYTPKWDIVIRDAERAGVRVAWVREDKVVGIVKRRPQLVDFESEQLTYGSGSTIIMETEPFSPLMQLMIERAGWTSISEDINDRPHMLVTSDEDLRTFSSVSTTYVFAYCANLMPFPRFVESRQRAIMLELDDRFGEFIRSTIYAYCRYNSYKYVGLGDTVAQMKSAAKAGIQSEHVNDERLTIERGVVSVVGLWRGRRFVDQSGDIIHLYDRRYGFVDKRVYTQVDNEDYWIKQFISTVTPKDFKVDYVLGGQRQTKYKPLTNDQKVAYAREGVPFFVDGSDGKDFDLSEVPRGWSVHAVSGTFKGLPFEAPNDGVSSARIRDNAGKEWALLKATPRLLDDYELSVRRGNTTTSNSEAERDVIIDRNLDAKDIVLRYLFAYNFAFATPIPNKRSIYDVKMEQECVEQNMNFNRAEFERLLSVKHTRTGSYASIADLDDIFTGNLFAKPEKLPGDVTISLFGRGESGSKRMLFIKMEPGTTRSMMTRRYGWTDSNDLDELVSPNGNESMSDVILRLGTKVMFGTEPELLNDFHRGLVLEADSLSESDIVEWISQNLISEYRETGSGYPHIDGGRTAVEWMNTLQENDVLWISPPFVESIYEWFSDRLPLVTNKCYVVIPKWEDMPAYGVISSLGTVSSYDEWPFTTTILVTLPARQSAVTHLFNDLVHRRKYEDVANGNQHSGQAKLLIGEANFLRKYDAVSDDVVVAGAAPGTHYSDLARIFPHKTFHLYDDAYFSGDLMFVPNIILYNELYEGKHPTKHLLISDIRTSTDHIEVDMARQARWAASRNCAMASLKFRIIFNLDKMRYLKGDLILQAFARDTSTELRLYSNGKSSVEYDVRDIEEKMMYFNSVLRPRGYDHYVARELMKELTNNQRYAIEDYFRAEGHELGYYADYSIGVDASTLHGRIDDNTPWFRMGLTRYEKGDIFEKRSELNSFVVGLFSVSNIRNPVALESLRRVAAVHDRYMILYGNDGANKYWQDGLYGLSFSPGVVRGTFRGKPVADHCLPINKRLPRGAKLMTITEFIAALRYNMPIEYRALTKAFEGNHPIMSAWCVVTNVLKDFTDQSYQTVFMSHTHMVRLPSLLIRNTLQLPRFDLALPRLLAGASYAEHLQLPYRMYEGQPSFKVGTTSPIYIDPSGHMINMMLMSTFGLLDYDHYLETLRANVIGWFEPRGSVRRGLKVLASKGLLMEAQNDSFRLFHTIHDYRVAMLSVVYACAAWRLPVPVRPLIRTHIVIESLYRKYPAFSDNIHKGVSESLRRRRILA